jgi:4-hydroxy-tetrahydrodipicolinate synthase
MFTGSIVALVTPFKNGGINFDALRKLLDYHEAHRTDAILLSGTTGESPTLSYEEKLELFRFGKRFSKVPIIAGTGNYNTAQTIEMTRDAQMIGVSAALVITPYYNKPTQRGLYKHFKAVADNTNIPIIIYNVPGRTGVSIAPDVVAELSQVNNIVAIKEASGSLRQCFQIHRFAKKDFGILSGEDALTLPILACGGSGVISVTANVVPEMVKEMVYAYLEGDTKRAKELHYKLLPLTDALFVETNPIPVKTALWHLGFEVGPLRLPLVAPVTKSVELIKQEMRRLGRSIVR